MRPLPAAASRLLIERRHGGATVVVVLVLGVASLTRLVLLAWSLPATGLSWALPAAVAWGVLFDLATAVLVATPFVVGLALLPERAFERVWARGAAHLGVIGVAGVLSFGGLAEWLFWDEFGARFNFIAVDYLVYTREVTDNVRESYSMPLIFGAVVSGALALHGVLVRSGLVTDWLDNTTEGRGPRIKAALVWLCLAGTVAVTFSDRWLPEFDNRYERELARNGLWSLFAAFRNNELDYEQFYATRPIDEAFADLRRELAADGATPIAEGRDTLRVVRNEGAELHPNVIQITVESLSADFLSAFNRSSKLTPNLTALGERSLLFTNFYATGTRTDRGMEALTLAIPPTPGRSLIKRPRNAGLFTLGSVFRSRGYDTAFIYGGYGYFDNMNAFFGGNGYRVVDRASVSREDITFANAWGACDEDLFRWTLREADGAAAAGKPFHFFVMTTSNHRPFTFPEGRIDLPPKISGRAGAVKYTDFAIGEFLKAAETKPWYRNTVFVIVADHCASVAGRSDLPVPSYHIPLLVYAPGGQVKPGKVTDLTSQIDYAPTLLGLLNWSYASRFYGWDVRTAGGDRRALIGNYQHLGLYEPGELVVLRPRRQVDEFAQPKGSGTFEPAKLDADEGNEAIAYYQTASYLYRTGGYRELSPEEQAQALLASSQGDRDAAPRKGPTSVDRPAAQATRSGDRS